MSQGQKPKRDKTITSFTVEDKQASEVKSMPSVTKLLNRKSLGYSKEGTRTGSNQASRELDGDKLRFKTPKLYQADPSSPGTPLAGVSESTSEPAPDSTSSIALSTLAPETPVSKSRPSKEDLSLVPNEIPFEIENRASDLVQPSRTPVAPSSTQEAPSAISIESPSAQLAHPRIQPSTRKTHRAIQPLIVWDLQMLSSEKDPLGKGIQIVMQAGALQALFLSITPPPEGARVPHFIATAAVQPGNKKTLWTGLKWDPAVVPEMWNTFLRSGLIELSSPGTLTNQASNRNVVRSSFGVRPGEWLVLIRVGPPEACRGVIAFITTQSIASRLTEAMPFLTATPSQKDG